MTRIFHHYNQISDRQPPTLQPSHPLEGIKKGITRKAKPVVGKATNQKLTSVSTRRNVDIFVSRLHPPTESDDIIECVTTVISCELFISCITCHLIISLYCISFTGRVFSTVSWFLLVHACVCVCVYGLLPDSNKD